MDESLDAHRGAAERLRVSGARRPGNGRRGVLRVGRGPRVCCARRLNGRAAGRRPAAHAARSGDRHYHGRLDGRRGLDPRDMLVHVNYE